MHAYADGLFAGVAEPPDTPAMTTVASATPLYETGTAAMAQADCEVRRASDHECSDAREQWGVPR
jgi:hypothetical protein